MCRTLPNRLPNLAVTNEEWRAPIRLAARLSTATVVTDRDRAAMESLAARSLADLTHIVGY
jgi:hypothetical protein